MKNKGIIVAMIIILSIIVMGLIAFLYFVISGNFKFHFNIGKRSEKIIYDESYELDTINNIEVLSDAGDVKFEESTDGKIRVVVYGESTEKLKVDNYDNKLKINYSQKTTFFGINSYMSNITIYIPQNYDKEIKIDTDYGDINVGDLENATIDIKEDCGDVNLGKIKNVTIKNSYGDIKIEQVLNKLNIKSNCGDVKINKIELFENSEIKNDLGDIKIGETNYIYIDADVDLGDIKINTNNRHSEITLKIETDCGDIKVEN